MDVILSWLNERPYVLIPLLLLGAIQAGYFAVKIIDVLAQTFVVPGAKLRKFGKKGSWAVVTGASDGIGREFALQLAKAGFSVMLVARNREKLSTTAAEIEQKFGEDVSTKVHVMDFSKNDDNAYVSLASACEGLEISILVNNVGKSHDIPAYFVDTPQQEIDDILTINLHATLRVTYLILPSMIKRKRGLILNIGSFAGEIPSPMLATYSGTKAFLSTFTDALAEEVAMHNIKVEHVNTFFVVSNMSKIRKSSMLVPTPSTYVRSVLSKIGLPCGAVYSNRPNTSTPYWGHALADFGINLIGWKSFFIGYTHGMHKGIRKRALKKLEKQNKAQ